MAQQQQAARALGQIAAVIEYRLPDLRPHRVARLCDDPRHELAPLMAAYRRQPLQDELEARLCDAFELIDGPALPERIDAALFWPAYYRARAELREARQQKAGT